jgi:hypothetical protein
MDNELHRCASTGNLERVKELVEGGANMEELDEDGKTALMRASLVGYLEIVVYLSDHGANIAHTDHYGKTALHNASTGGHLPTVKFLFERGARMTERSDDGKTAFLYAACSGRLSVVKYLLSVEGGAGIGETDSRGRTALLLAATGILCCHPSVVTWHLEHGTAQITDTDNVGNSVWDSPYGSALPQSLICAYMNKRDGECVPTEKDAALTAMLRVMVLHGAPIASLTRDLAPPLQRIVQDGARLRARLPSYLARRRALLDAHCPLLQPLRDLVRGYEEPTTTDELWATGLGALLQRAKRSRSERGQSIERRSARLGQKRQ